MLKLWKDVLSMTQAEALANFKSRKCVCGNEKALLHSFCRGCYARLPRSQETAPWRKLGAGYESAHDTALATLRRLGRVKEAA